MSNVDNRMVKLEMDVNSFEINAKTAIQTLESLNKALQLNGSTEGVKNLQGALSGIDVRSVSNNIEDLTNRFSTLGIVGATAIQKLAGGLMDFGANKLKKWWDNSIGQIMTGGWNRATNIDLAKFKMVEGMGINWDEMKKNIDYAVGGTAYGFDEAAKAAAQLAASGVEYQGDMNDMAKTLRAISGVAAMTNSSYSDIAYTFTQIAAQGRVMKYQLNMITHKGLNATAKIAESLGKTQEQVLDMIRKGEVTSKMFFDAMFNEYEAFATKANQTYEGAMANMKAALSRIGEPFYAPIRESMVGVYNAWRLFWNDVKAAISESGLYDEWANLVNKWNDLKAAIISRIPTSWITSIASKIKDAFSIAEGVIDQIKSWIDLFPILHKEADSSIGATTEATNELSEAASEAKGSLEEIANAVIRGDYGNGEERIQKLGDAFKYVQNRVNEILDHPHRYTLTAEEEAKAIEALGESVIETGVAIVKNDDQFGRYIYENGKMYFRYIGTIGNESEKASISIAGIISAFKLLGDTGKAVLKGIKGPVIELGKSIGNSLLNAGATIGDWFIKAYDSFEKSGGFEKIESGVNTFAEFIKNRFLDIKGALGITFTGLGIGLGKLGSGVAQLKGKFDEFLAGFTKTQGFNKLKDTFSSIKESLNKTKDSIFSSITSRLSELAGTDFKLPEFDVSGAIDAMDKVASWISDRLEDIKSAFGSFSDFVGGIGEGLKGDFSKIFDNLSQITMDDVKKSFKGVPGTIHDLIFGKEVAASEFYSGIGMAEDQAAVMAQNAQSMAAQQAAADAQVAQLNAFFGMIGEKLAPAFSGLKEGSSEFFDEMIQNMNNAENVKEVLYGITDQLVQLGPGGVLKSVTTALKAVFAVKLWKNLVTLPKSFSQISDASAKFVTRLTSPAVGLKNIEDSISNVIDAFKSPKNIKRLNKSIGSLIKHVGKGSYKVMKAFGKGLPSVMKGFSKDLKAGAKVLKAYANEANANAIFTLAKAIGLLAIAFLALSQLSWTSIGKGAVAIGALTAAIAFLMWRLEKSSGGSKSLNPGERLTNILDGLKNSIKGFLTKAGWGALLVSFGASIALLASAIKKISELDAADATRSAWTVVGLIAVLSLAIIAMSRLGGKNTTLRQSILLIAIAAAINALVPAIQALGKMSNAELRQGQEAVLVLAGIMAGLMIASKFMGKGNIGTFVGMIGLLAALVGVIAAVSLLPDDKLEKVSSALAKLVAALALFTASTGQLGRKGSFASMIGIGALLAEIAIILSSAAGLSTDEIERVGLMADAISSVLSGAALNNLSSAVVSKWTTWGGLLKSIVNTTIIGVIGIVLAELVGWFAENDSKGLEDLVNNKLPWLSQILEKIGDLLGSFGGGLIGGALRGVKNSLGIKGPIDSLPDVADRLNEFGEKMQKFKTYGWDTMASSMESMVSMLSIFAGSAVTGLGTGAYKILTHPIDTFWDAINPFSKKGPNGPVEDAFEQLNAFADNVKIYAEKIKGFDESAVEKSDAAIGMFQNVKMPMFTSGIMTWFHNNKADYLGGQLEEFAQGLVKYSIWMSHFDSNAVTGTQDAVKVIQALTGNITPITGFVSSLFGETNRPDDFGNTLEPFAKGLKAYADVMKDLDTNAVTGTEDAVKIIIELGKAVPEMQVLKDDSGEFLTDQTLFGESLPAFALGMVMYSAIIGKLDTAAVENTMYAAAIIIALAKAVDFMKIQDVGWDGSIITDQTLFGTSLPAFALGMVVYSKYMGHLDTTAVENTRAAAQMIIDLAAAVPKDTKGSVLGLLIGSNDIGDFGSNLKDFGKGLADYSKEIEGFNFENAVRATRQVRNLLMTFNEFSSDKATTDIGGTRIGLVTEWIKQIYGDLLSYLESPDTIGSLEQAGAKIFEGLVNGINAPSGEEGEGESLSGKLIKALTDETGINEGGEDFIGKFFEACKTALTAHVNDLDEGTKGVLDAMKKVAEDYKEDFDGVVEGALIEIRDIIATDTSVPTAVGTVGDAALTTARSYIQYFVGIGGDMMSGLAAGITFNSGVVTAAVGSAMDNAVAIAKAKIDSHSPSKVFMKIGGWMMEGAGIGITNSEHYAIDAVSSAASHTVTAMTNALGDNQSRIDEKMQDVFRYLESAYAYINSVISDSLDVQPTITPVVDLSQIQNGLNNANGLFANSGLPFGMNSLNYARSMWPGSYQYGAQQIQASQQAGVISAIRGIRSDLAYLGESIQSMQMVMDSGAVVGSIGGGMDRELGKIQMYKERWA